MSILAHAVGDDYTDAGLDIQSQEVNKNLGPDYNALLALLQSGRYGEAQDMLKTAQAVTPGYNDLALGELERNAGRATAVQGQMDAGQAAADINNLNTYGAQAGTALRSTAASADPEYYRNLELAGGKMADAFNAWSPDLSAGQRAEVERGAARMNPGGGGNSAADLANKVSQFGSAHQQQVQNFTSAINSISAALPNLRSGLNPVATALGRDSRTGSATGAITPVVKPDNTAFTVGGNVYSTLWGQEANKQNNAAKNFKSWGDAMEQDSRILSNVGSAASSFGA